MVETSSFSNQDLSKVSNFKLVDQKYFIKTVRLGRGNFAETYLSTLKSDEKIIYACKMIKKENIIEKLKSSKNPEQRKEYIINSLRNEVQLWKELDHKNIVKFIEFSETENNIYFFLEFCDSGDLEKELKKRTKYPEKDALKVMKQITDGAAYLYDKGVFHRDLKPENILIHQGQAKIADFGFSKVIEAEKRDVAVLGTAVGTPFYMAPQILEGEEYSIKCDVWSLGIVFYQMLFGFLPWSDNTSIMQLLNKIKSDSLVFPPNQPISPALKELIQGMLIISDKNRISILEVQSKLDEIIKNSPQ